MSKKYHYNSKTGRMNMCNAKVKNCPLGDVPHVVAGSSSEAKSIYEKEYKEENKTESYLSKKKETVPNIKPIIEDDRVEAEVNGKFDSTSFDNIDGIKVLENKAITIGDYAGSVSYLKGEGDNSFDAVMVFGNGLSKFTMSMIGDFKGKDTKFSYHCNRLSSLTPDIYINEMLDEDSAFQVSIDTTSHGSLSLDEYSKFLEQMSESSKFAKTVQEFLDNDVSGYKNTIIQKLNSFATPVGLANMNKNNASIAKVIDIKDTQISDPEIALKSKMVRELVSLSDDRGVDSFKRYSSRIVDNILKNDKEGLDKELERAYSDLTYYQDNYSGGFLRESDTTKYKNIKRAFGKVQKEPEQDIVSPELRSRIKLTRDKLRNAERSLFDFSIALSLNGGKEKLERAFEYAEKQN